MARSVLVRTREQFQDTGALSAAGVRPEVLASWLRCRDEYRVDPSRRSAEVRAGGAETQDSDELRLVAEPILRRLLPAVAASNHLLILSDERGRLLWLDGYQPLVRLARERNIVLGSIWDEATEGTNGIGTALASGHSFEVVQGEHFCQGWQDLTCTGGLIRHPRGGQIAGVVDVTGRRTLPQAHTLALIESTAMLIEREWSALLRQRAWLVAEAFVPYALRYPVQPVLAFDADGYVVQATPAACSLVGLDPSGERCRLPAPAPRATSAAVVAALRHADAEESSLEIVLPLGAPLEPLGAVLTPLVREGRPLGAMVVIDRRISGERTPAQAPGQTETHLRRPATRLVGSDADGRLRVVDVRCVLYARADTRAVWLYTSDGALRSTYATLQALAAALPGQVFFQANRGDLVNLAAIAEIEPAPEKSFELVLGDAQRTHIPVSRRRLPQLHELLHF